MLCGNQTISPYAAPPVLGSGKVVLSVSSGSGGSGGSGGSAKLVSSVEQESALPAQDLAALQYWRDHAETDCYTAPFVKCGESAIWTPLWNLHVHSKNTQDYKSVPCDCPV